jgi:hypothetical protein
MRLIHSIVAPKLDNESAVRNLVKVYRDSANDEFVCKLFISGKHKPRADYFTNDKADAIATAEHMVAANG